ncbi:MAG: ABC transporter substrate-binding protein [Thermodesulfobacteriota bacterium]
MLICRTLILTLAVWCCSVSLRAEDIQYRLKWLYNVSVIGDIYAEAGECFDRVGLKVEVKEGGPERDAIKEVEMGYAQFGVASADQIIRALSKGAPIVVIAQLFQENPLQWMYRPGRTRIEKPSDLHGKTIGITFGGNDETVMRTILIQSGIHENDVRLYSVRYDYTPFYQARVDLWPVYVNAQAPIIRKKLEAAGEKTALFNPTEMGIRFVANSVITSRKLASDRPDLINRFLSALLEGWQLAMDPTHATEALQVLSRFDRDTAPDIMAEQLDATRRLVHPPGTTIGAIDVSAWRQTENILLQQKIIPRPVHIERFLSPRP